MPINNLTSISNAPDSAGPYPAITDRLPSLAEEPHEAPTARQRLGYVLGNPGKNFLVPVAWLQALMRTSRSPLIAESFVHALAGGWRARMEIIYRNAAPVDWLDRQALRDNPFSMAARNRRKIVSERLTSLIRKQNSFEHLMLLGIGAGPGRHLQTAIVESGIATSSVTAFLLDLADDVVPYGRALAASFGLQGSVQFLQGDACRIRETLPGNRFHIAKLVGIIEYLTDTQLAELLEAVREVIKPGGSLVTHGLVDKYGTGRFLARVFNLRLQQRDTGQMTKLLARTGFRITDCEYEPAGIYPIVTAVCVE